MAQTPYRDLKSTDILSSYVSGLQHSVNKLEEVLDMKTQRVAGHMLNPVTDQTDPAIRYRIYEGTIRNWLDQPEPVIYRNGTAVEANEYVSHPAYGAVVFQQQQAPDDMITADFDHIIPQARFNDTLQGLTPILHTPGYYRSHSLTSGALATDVLIAANLFDAFPFPVPETAAYDQIAIKVDSAAASGTTARLGIYRDNGNAYPGDLVLDAGTVPADVAGVQALPINLTLNRGLYWLVRNADGDPGLSGIQNANAISLGIDDSLMGHPAGAIRQTATYGALPDTYPSGGAPLFRSVYASVWMRKGE